MITPKLKELALAMAEFERWAPVTGSAGFSGPASVSYRNHNPGNLRRSPFALGARDGFAFFLDDDTGLFALVWDLWMKCQGKTSTGLTGESSIEKLIWAYTGDPVDVKRKYVEFVEQEINLPRSTKLKLLIAA